MKEYEFVLSNKFSKNEVITIIAITPEEAIDKLLAQKPDAIDYQFCKMNCPETRIAKRRSFVAKCLSDVRQAVSEAGM